MIALLIMAALLLLGTTFLTISTTETEIARNAREATEALYVASTGLARLQRDLVAQFAAPYQALCSSDSFSSIADFRQLTRISGEPLGVPGQQVDGDGSATCAKPGTPYYVLSARPDGGTWVTVPYAGPVVGNRYQVEVRNATPPNATPPQLPNTIEARVTATTGSSTGASREIQVQFQMQRFSPAEHALFVEGGVWRWGGVGNVTIAGPVFAKGWSVTYPAMQLGYGGATDGLVNYYKNLDPALQAAIPPPPVKPNPTTGEPEFTLDTTLRVFQGPVEIQSTSSAVGEATVSGNGAKESLTGVYTNQGFTGSPGAAQVYSDNGTGNRMDVPRDLLTYPELSGPYSGPPLAGGAGSPSHDAYLRANGLGIDGGLTIDASTQSFSAPPGLSILDQSGNPNPNPCSGTCLVYETRTNPPTLMLNGIVWVKGDVVLGGYGSNRLSSIQYRGAGSLYARAATPDLSWGSIEVTSDLLPSPLRSDGTTGAKFPTDHRLGLISSGWVEVGDWSTAGAPVPPLKIAASIYAAYTMFNYAPYQVAGSVMARYFYVSQTAGIYYVPSVAGARPPGMPGVSPAKATSPYFLRTLSWRDVMP